MNTPLDKFSEQIRRQIKKEIFGSSVTLYVSLGKETMELTDYVGRDFEEIANFLEGFGFKIRSGMGSQRCTERANPEADAGSR